MASMNYNTIVAVADCVKDEPMSLRQDLHFIQDNINCTFVAIDCIMTYFYGLNPPTVEKEPEKDPNCFMDEMMQTVRASERLRYISEKLRDMITLDRT